MFRRTDLEDPQVERLIAGDPAGLPDSYQRVAEAMQGIRGLGANGHRTEKSQVAAMAAAVRSPEEVRAMTPKIKTPRRLARRIQVAAVAVAGALVLMTSLAFAGGLPGAAQDAAHDLFASFGVDVPAGENAPDAADSRGDQADDVRQDGDAGANGGVTTQDGEDGGEIADDAQNIPSDENYLENSADLADEASDGNSTTGTDTAEGSADTAPTDAGPQTGEEAAEEGSGNADDFRP